MIINTKKENSQFWEYGEKGKLVILNRKLISFIEKHGFVNVKLSETNYDLARANNNRLKMVSTTDVDHLILGYLQHIDKGDVLEAFTRGVSGYLSSRKLSTLRVIEPINDRDGESWSRLYFKNCYCEITSETIKVMQYDSLKNMIWENRVLDHNFELPEFGKGDFEMFCHRITGDIQERFLALKSAIGYLLHRNKMVGESAAVIFYDANMGIDNQTHGGTGKTLLRDALSLCREVVSVDGKDVKFGSYFKNQRINLTTDILVYDDLRKDISLENFYRGQ